MLNRREVLKATILGSTSIPLFLNEFSPERPDSQNIEPKKEVPFRTYYQAEILDRKIKIKDVVFPSLTQRWNECIGFDGQQYMSLGKMGFGDLSFVTVADDAEQEQTNQVFFDLIFKIFDKNGFSSHSNVFPLVIKKCKRDSVEVVMTCDASVSTVFWNVAEESDTLQHELTFKVRNVCYHSV